MGSGDQIQPNYPDPREKKFSICYKARVRICSSNEKEVNYKNEIKDDKDLDQANDKYLSQLWKAMGGSYR